METARRFFWWCRTKFFGLNGEKPSQILIVTGSDRDEAESQINDRLGGLDCWQRDGNLEGPYESEAIAYDYAKHHDQFKRVSS